jgi:sugar O-acyltransferase (sialic acid O-acetyltransferase NeuD family)
VGAGGHGRVVADTARTLQNWSSIAFIDGAYPKLTRIAQWPVIGKDTEADRFLADYPESAVAIGDNRSRLALAMALENMGFLLPVIVHPKSWLSTAARVGVGTILVAGAVVNIGASLGRACIVNTGATVDHDCSIGDGVHVSPGAHIGGEVRVGDRTWIGIGASVRHGVKLGSDVVVGAGAAVVEDVGDRTTVMGVPAKIAQSS